MEILNSRKTFADVKEGEKLYCIDPSTQKIIDFTVKKSFLHTKSKNQQVWVIVAYMPFKLEYITDEKLKAAESFGTVVTNTMYLPKTDVMALLAAKQPTVVATEKEYIETWMRKGKSGLILPKRNW